MPYESKAIANEILRIAQARGSAVSHMKLQKLVYYAHGWNLAIQKCPLLNERIEAWKFGPVVPSLYQEFKGVGSGTIQSPAMMTSFSDGHVKFFTPSLETCTDSTSEKDDFTRRLLNKIWDMYGKYDAMQLSEATHRAGTPWHTIRSQFGDVKGIDIPDELIQRYFESVAQRHPTVP